MRILCTNQALDGRGGSESYLETVIDELLKLGHEIHAWSFRLGPVAERLSNLGCLVHSELSDVGTVDIIHAQHASTAMAARAHFPDVPLVFASHSYALDIEDPPAASAPAALLAFNDNVMARLRASRLGEHVPLYRLRQPVPIDPVEPNRILIRDPLRRALLVAPQVTARRALLEEACRRIGTQLHLYEPDDPLDDPTTAMMNADVVFCAGRTALEAMALGRAAFIFAETGSAGFVTADTYPTLEAHGFTPSAAEPATVESVVAELGCYEPGIGAMGRELVGRHHMARTHVIELIDIYRSVMQGPPPPVDSDAAAELATVLQRNFELGLRTRHAEWQLVRLEQQLVHLEQKIQKIWESWSWRLTRPLRAVAGVRARRSRGPR